MNNNQLQQILQGCLNPETVKYSEKQLVEYSQKQTFMIQLLQMVPNQSPNLLMMILSTLKNYCQQKYTHPVEQERISEQNKDLLRSNLFNFFYQINHNPQAINLYKEILFLVVSQDYESKIGFFSDLLKADLDGPIMASVYFFRQIAHVYEYMNYKDREPLQHFVSTWFPRIEDLVEKILSNYNDQTSRLLEELLFMFYQSFHIEIPEYLRNFQNLNKWLLYFKTIFQSPVKDFPNNHFQVSRIYVKIMSMYCFDESDGKTSKGWSNEFRNKYASDLYSQIIQILINPVGGQDTVSNIVVCIYHICRNPNLRNIIEQSHCQHIIYKYLLPFMQSTSEDEQYFYSDQLEYIRRLEDLTCHPFRRSSLDLIHIMMTNINFGNKSQLIKFVQYSAQVLGSISNDRQKQVILITLTQLSKLIMKNKYLHGNFQNLVIQYFLPLMKNSNPIIASQTMKLLAQYLTLSSLTTQTVTQLLGSLYEHMRGNSLVLKYHAILSFTQLLDNKQALENARPHFKNILQIYVKMLQVMDHENLIKSLESVVKIFSNQIASVADNLSNHLFNLFHELHKKDADNDNNDQQTCQAVLPLSTIVQILNSPLSPETFIRISENAMILLQNLCTQYDDYFEQILKLINSLVYYSPAISNYELPYVLCRKLLQGNNQILSSINNNNSGLHDLVSQAEKADYQYSDLLVSILKNLIQKMPEQILHQYPYPTNPQLLLCLIENKKLSQQGLSNLNTSEVDEQWSYILQSYTSAVYNVGQVSNPKLICLIPGISYYPWIQNTLSLDVIKRVLYTLKEEQEEDDDDYYQQNTAQMLEKYANEDEEEDFGDFHPNFQTGNYSQNYDSPFDYKKDIRYLVNKLKQLNNNQLSNMIQQLNPDMKNKLEALFNQY